MTPSPSDQAEAILAATLDHAPEDREAFLLVACGENSELLSRARALLAKVEGQSNDLDVTLAHTPVTRLSPPIRMPAEPTEPAPAAIQVDNMPTMLDTRASVSRSLAEEVVADLPLGANPDAAASIIFGKRIAQGGMGAIMEADDCKLGRKIAVKIMRLEFGADEEQKQRFIQEAAVLGRLEHPNIVPIHELGRDSDGSLYYTMKLVQGHTLQDILNDLQIEKPDALREYSLECLLTIFCKVCDAIAFAHSRRVLHRDLKPENIMVGDFGEVLVMDWGLAKILDAGPGESIDALAHTVFDRSTGQMTRPGPEITVSSSQSLTATLQGTVMGTPKYMSPEQAMGQIDELDERSDIFSLGGILYTILTLRPPVEGKTVEEVLAKVTGGTITPPTAFGTTASSSTKRAKGAVLEAEAIKPLPHIPAGRVPPAISAVAMKSLRLDKKERYQEVEALSADIEKFQGGFATSAEQAGLGKQVLLLVKRNKGIFSTAAAAWLLIMALAVWFIVHLRESEARAVSSARKDRAQAYSAQIGTAVNLIGDHDLIGARQLLERFIPQSGQDDIRGFEWRHLWTQAISEDIAVVGGYQGRYGGIAISPDGKWMARYSQHGIVVQRVSDAEVVTSIDTRTDDGRIAPGVLRFSPNGNFLVSATPEATRRWRIGSGSWEEQPIIKGVGSPFLFLSDSRLVARSGDHLTIRNSETWAQEKEWDGHFLKENSTIRNQVFAASPDGKFLYLVDQKRVRCWNLDSSEEIQLPPGGEGAKYLEFEWPFCLAMSRQHLLAAGLWEGKVVLWNSVSKKIIQTIPAHRSLVSAVAFTEDGSQLITTSADRGIAIFDIDADGQATLRSRLAGHEGEVSGLALVPGSNRFFTGSLHDDSTRLWEMPSSSGTEDFQAPGILSGRDRSSGAPQEIEIEIEKWVILPLEFEAEEDALIAWTTSGFVRFDLLTGARTPVPELTFPSEVDIDEKLGLPSVDPDPLHTQISTRKLWAQGEASEIRIWNLKIGKQEHHLPEPGLRSKEGVADVNRIKNPFAFSPDGSLFATANEINGVRLWHCSGWAAYDLAPEFKQRARLCFSADNRVLVAVTQSEEEARPDHGIAFNLKTKRVISEIDFSSPVLSVALSPDGKTLAAGLINNQIELWDLEKGEKQGTLNRHLAAVFGLAFSPDGRTLASTGDRRLLLWNIETRSELMTLFEGSPWLRAPLFSPDGRFLASYVGEKQLHVWRAPAWEQIK